MELNLTIFFASTFLVLAGNAVLLWCLRRMLARASERARARQTEHARLIDALRVGVRVAEESTSRMAIVSGQIRSAAGELDSGLGRADNWARYGLAKLDFSADRASKRLEGKARDLGNEVRKPLYRTAAAIHGVKAVLNILSRWKPGAKGRLGRAARVVGPLDTAATVFQAVTALGSLLSGGNTDDDIDDRRTRSD